MGVFVSKSERATRNLARRLLKTVSKRIFCLYGDLGAGKTIFCKGLAEALGIPEKKIKSPTYVLLRQYAISGRVSTPDVQKKTRQSVTGPCSIFYHCDFYRIQQPDHLLTSELEEIFSQKNAIIAIEWPERIEKLLPEKRTNIYFEYKDPKTRVISDHD